ncbi:IS3 family transposase, partial [Pseudomonas gingeri]|uniref:IS3 family transposase n=2 Tax=Pseudomonas gingeri TaxID=117681 RepID=UPI00210C0118
RDQLNGKLSGQNRDELHHFLGHDPEFFYLNKFNSLDELEAGIEDYIHYYNHSRIRLKLSGLSPVEYRTQARRA